MFDPWVGKTPWSKKWQSTPLFLPGEFHGKRSLVGYSPWGGKELDMTGGLFIYFIFFSSYNRNLQSYGV